MRYPGECGSVGRVGGSATPRGEGGEPGGKRRLEDGRRKFKCPVLCGKDSSQRPWPAYARQGIEPQPAGQEESAPAHPIELRAEVVRFNDLLTGCGSCKTALARSPAGGRRATKSTKAGCRQYSSQDHLPRSRTWNEQGSGCRAPCLSSNESGSCTCGAIRDYFTNCNANRSASFRRNRRRMGLPRANSRRAGVR